MGAIVRPRAAVAGGVGADGTTSSREDELPVEPCPVDPNLELEVSAPGTPTSAVASESETMELTAVP